MEGLDDRAGEGYEIPGWEALNFFNAWMAQMLRQQQHNMLLAVDLIRRMRWL